MQVHLLSSMAQIAYTWLMVFGLMGMFRHLLVREHAQIRYLSDASYWMYLAHFPLIIALQYLVQSWPLNSWHKFLLICAVATAILLLAYQTLVRYTWLGALLNGRRRREAK
jgi:peptidoglycan/LPS O-acetylase OafA/YrhL